MRETSTTLPRSPYAGEPLAPQLRRQIADLIERDGESATYRRLEIPRATLARAVGGLGLRRPTIAWIVARLSPTNANGGPATGSPSHCHEALNAPHPKD